MDLHQFPKATQGEEWPEEDCRVYGLAPCTPHSGKQGCLSVVEDHLHHEPGLLARVQRHRGRLQLSQSLLQEDQAQPTYER